MIPRHRLRGRRRFAAIRRDGARASRAGVRAQLARNQRDVARVGLAVVGIRSAVLRNLLRRRLREAVRPLLGGLSGHDVVLVAGAEAAGLPFTGLREAVHETIAGALARSRRADPGATADNAAMSSPAEARP